MKTKRSYFLLALLVLGAAVAAPAVLARPRQAPDPAIAALVARVDRDRLLDDVRRLSGDLPLCNGAACLTISDRGTGGGDLAFAMDHIAARGRALGYEVTVEPWAWRGLEDRNVLLERRGVVTPTELVFYVAHVDGVSACEGRCPGADDNASGAAAGLELARLLSDVPVARTVVIMFTTGEEQEMFGVLAWLKQRDLDDLTPIVGLLNADMIGFDGDGNRVMEIYHGNSIPSMALARRAEPLVAAYGLDLVPRQNQGCG